MARGIKAGHRLSRPAAYYRGQIRFEEGANERLFMSNPKRARSWKRRIQPRVGLRAVEPVLYSTWTGWTVRMMGEVQDKSPDIGQSRRISAFRELPKGGKS